MSDLKKNYDVYIDDIISSFKEISSFIGKSSENESYVQRSYEIVNVTSIAIKISQSERQLVLQELINSLSQLYNLTTCKITVKLVLKSLDKLMILAKFVSINTHSINCILNLLKKIFTESNNDSELLLKLMQIILSLSSPNSLIYHDNNLFQQSFNLLCLIGKKMDGPKTNEIVTAALENLLLQLTSLYTIKLDKLCDENKFNQLFNEHINAIYHSSECEIILHTLLSDFINLIAKKDVLFAELTTPKALDFILLISNNLSLECIKNDPNVNKVLIDILFQVEYLIYDSKVMSKYILMANGIFEILPNITQDFVTQVISLCNKSHGNVSVVLLLICLLVSNHPRLKAENSETTKLLNHFTNKLFNMKYSVSDLSISSADVLQAVEEINDTCINLSRLLSNGKLEPLDTNKYTCIICLQGIISIMLKHQRESVTLHNGKPIFQIFLSSEQSTKLVYSSLNLLYGISDDKQFIMEFVCNRALYDVVSIYPLDCVYNIFKQIDVYNEKLLEMPIRTLIRVIYNIVGTYNGDPTIEILHSLIDELQVGKVINQFVAALGNHVLRPNIIDILNDCLKSTNLFRKKFGIEIYLYLVKSGSLDDIIESLKLLNIKDDKFYHYATLKYFDEINTKIQQSTDTPLLNIDDWEKLFKLHFSSGVIDTLNKCLDEKMNFLGTDDWHYIILTLAKTTSVASDKAGNCDKVIQMLEQIVDNGDFDIQSTIVSLFECIGNCCKNFCIKDNQDCCILGDNEGFRLVGIIWKIADLIGKDGITNEQHWWHVLQSLIKLSMESSIAIKICSIRSLTTTMVTYWKLFQFLLPMFFFEWNKVINVAKDNDDLVDQESLFNVCVHETLEVMKAVEFEEKYRILSQFIDLIASRCEVSVFADIIEYLNEYKQYTDTCIYIQTIEHFINRAIEYVEAKDSPNCTKISEVALKILKSKCTLASDNYVIIISLIHLVTINNRSLFTNGSIGQSKAIVKANGCDYLDLWFGYMENLIVSIKSDVIFFKSSKIIDTLTNLNYHDASTYIISNYNSILNAVSLHTLEKVLSNSNVYETYCQRDIKDFVYTICSLSSHISISCFNRILDAVSQCFSNCCCVLIERLVHIMQQMVCNQNDDWLNLIPSFVRLLKYGLFRVDFHLFYIDKITQVIRYLLITRQHFPDELLTCVYSISSRTADFNNETMTLHLVLINLLEMALLVTENIESMSIDVNNTMRMLYEILDIYADNIDIGYNVTLRYVLLYLGYLMIPKIQTPNTAHLLHSFCVLKSL